VRAAQQGVLLGRAGSVALIAATSLLAACSLVRRPPPPPPPAVIAPPPNNIDTIPDAVPRIEPRSALGNPPSYEQFGRRYYVLASASGFVEQGVASWYGPGFHEKSTSSGEPYDMYAMTAAHKTLPLPTYVRVTNLSNGKSIVVRINDRGPFIANRIIDLSYTAAAKLDMLRDGTALVEVRALTPGRPEVPTLIAASPVSATPSPVSVAVTPASAVAPLVPEEPTPASAAATPIPAAVTPAPATPIAATVNPAPATPAPAATTPAAGPATAASAATLYLQAGAFADPRNAQRALARLLAAGVSSAFILNPPGSSLYRVRVGPLGTVDEIDRWAERLAHLGFADAIVVRAD
jgi:rare lipoprotein A